MDKTSDSLSVAAVVWAVVYPSCVAFFLGAGWSWEGAAFFVVSVIVLLIASLPGALAKRNLAVAWLLLVAGIGIAISLTVYTQHCESDGCLTNFLIPLLLAPIIGFNLIFAVIRYRGARKLV